MFQKYYQHPANAQIVLQGFFHFLKIMDLAASPADVIQIFQGISAIEGLTMPVEDTLNIKNGLNYAQFLEALLRIAFIKSGETNQSYAATLEQIFQNPSLDIAKRTFNDSFLNQIYNSEENDEVFREYELLLCAIFSTKGINRNSTYLEMEKPILVQLLKDAGIIKVPQVKKAEAKPEERKGAGKKAEKDKKEEEKKEEPVIPAEQLYLEADCLASIEPVNSFEEGMLNYFDVLECLLRVARDYKFSAEEEALLTSLPKRLDHLLKQLDAKFGEQMVQPFLNDRELLERTKVYQPRSVVDDDAGAMYEDDD